MCKVGGPRCALADELHKARQRVRRSSEYRQAGVLQREVLLREAENAFRREHPEEVLAHAPKRQAWNTRSKPLEERYLRLLRKQVPKLECWGKERGQERTREMYEEYEAWQERLTEDEQDAIVYYTQNGYEYINPLLRHGEVKVRDPWGDGGTLQRARETSALLRSALSKAPQQGTTKTLYRHQFIPPGMTPEQFIERYYAPGEVVRDKAFMSTTEDTAYLAGYLHKHAQRTGRRAQEHVVFQLMTRQGASVVRSPHEDASSVQYLEKERLLPEGVRFRVLGSRVDALSVPEEREAYHARFASKYDPIKPRRVRVVMLMEEELVEKHLPQK